MKKLLTILIFCFYPISQSQGDDISSFAIEGISVGDSLLTHFNKSEIKKNEYFLEQSKENKKYKKFGIIKNSGLYDKVSAAFKTSDQKYKTVTVEGIIWFKDDINSCLKKKDEIVKELSDLFKDQPSEDKGKKVHFADKNSYTYGYNILFGDVNDWPPDYIAVTCYDWSKDLRYWDHLRVGIVKKEYSEWLNELSKR
jgi:hypothetical protein